MAKTIKSEIKRHLNDIFFDIAQDLQDANKLTDAVVDEVAEDLIETADPEDWHGGDVAISLTRVLKNKLGIEE